MLNGLQPGDDRVALAPLASVPLDRIGRVRSLTTAVVIPDTPQWTRIRRVWGDPEFVISAVSSARSFAYCIPDSGLKIIAGRQGTLIPLVSSYAPYGYSWDCAGSSLKFRATPGTKIVLTIAKTDERTLPPGGLIVMSDWPNVKDKIVGVMLDQELRPWITAMSISGFVLLVAAAYVFFRRRHWQNRARCRGAA